jgi:hypothetical protein
MKKKYHTVGAAPKSNREKEAPKYMTAPLPDLVQELQ